MPTSDAILQSRNPTRGRRPSRTWRLRALLTAALALALTGCQWRQARPGHSLRVSGAQIPVELLESWVRSARAPGFALTRVDPVFLSRHGFDNLLAGKVDLACTDRPITPPELQDFRDAQARRQRGETEPDDVEKALDAKTAARAKKRDSLTAAGVSGESGIEGRRIGFYGFALYVHPDNPLDSIYAGHLRFLFQKKASTWQEIGVSPDANFETAIRLIGPEKATRGGDVLMRQAKIWFADPTWETMKSDGQIVEAVAGDRAALGFASIGLDKSARYLGLRMERGSQPGFPSLEEIETERYGLAKVIYLYYPMPPTPAVQDLLAYLQSESGRSALQTTEVWPIAAERSLVKPAP